MATGYCGKMRSMLQLTHPHHLLSRSEQVTIFRICASHKCLTHCLFAIKHGVHCNFILRSGLLICWSSSEGILELMHMR